ncbi:Peroxin-3 [Kalaharituber pfeilii]|nr:Peroxin-3 [Kalaharituber pfeilii]
MFTSVKNFIKRNKTNIAIGVGLAGAAYVVVRSKFSEAKDRMSSDRIAKENLKRRFETNQQDCSLTVLELLPTAAHAIMKDMPVERITQELQEKKANKLARSSSLSHGSITGDNSVPDTPSPTSSPAAREDDNQSLQSFASESFGMGAFSVEGGRRRGGKSRTQLWNDIKISSITRAFTLIYTLALLTILTRVQLNLLGRKNYLLSVHMLADRDDHPTITLIDNDTRKANSQSTEDEVNRQYLIFSWWFLHKGWRRVKDRVEAAVKQVFGPYNPRDTISLSQLRDLTMQVRKAVEVDDGPSLKWITMYLLPTRDEEKIVFTESGYTQAVPPPPAVPSAESSQASTPAPTPLEIGSSPALRKMLDETSDLLDSPNAAVVMHMMLELAFGVLIEERIGEQVFKKAADAATAASTAQLAPPPPEPTKPSLPPSGSSMLPIISVTEHQDSGGVESTPLASYSTCVSEQASPMPEEDPTTKLASVLAVMTREAQAIGGRVPNDYLQAMESARDLEGFSALVYSNFGNEVQWDSESAALLQSGSETTGGASSSSSSSSGSGSGSGCVKVR